MDDGTQIPATVVSEPPDLALWQALFDPETPVRSHTFDDYANRPIVSFPVADVLGYVKDRYQAVASLAPFDLPGVTRDEGDDRRQDVLDQVFQELVALYGQPLRVPDEATLSRILEQRLEDARAVARLRHAAGERAGGLIEPTGMGGPGTRQMRSSAPCSSTTVRRIRPSRSCPRVTRRGRSSRRRWTSTRWFRPSGTIRPCYAASASSSTCTCRWMPCPGLPDERSLRKVRVVPTWVPTLPADDYSPWTVYGFAARGDLELFEPISRQGESAGGLWTAPDADLVQVDVDGAALKTLNLASTLARVTLSGAPRAVDAPQSDGIPTLRTSGIAVVRLAHASHLNDTFNRSGQINALLESVPPQLADLYAEDLIRGYRLDILEGRTGQWRSLHQRVGTYTVTAAPELVPPLTDEGFTQASVTSSPARRRHRQIQARSCTPTKRSSPGMGGACPRRGPGKGISRTARAPQPDEPETQPQRVVNTAMTRLGLETSFAVQAGTLPRLRFGQAYRLRARTVDLAGNGLSLDEATAVEAAFPRLQVRLPRVDDLVYRRFEPINPPEVVPRLDYRDGESLAQLVVRSNFDVSAADYAIAQPAYEPTSERHVVPPRPRCKPSSCMACSTRARCGAGPGRGRAGRPPGNVWPGLSGGRRAARAPSRGTARGALSARSLGSGRGSARPARRGPDEPLTISFGGPAWYTPTPFRIQLVEGDPASTFDEAHPVLTIQLPKAAQARVRLSSQLTAPLNQLGLWYWLREGVERGVISDARYAELEQGILESRHWMFTPFRELTLVHAVQQPLQAPAPRLEIDRLARQHRCLSARGHLAARAEHVEGRHRGALEQPRDDPSRDDPGLVDIRAQVMELPTALDGPLRSTYPEAPDALRLEDDERLVFTGQADYARRETQGDLDDPGPTSRPRSGDTGKIRSIWRAKSLPTSSAIRSTARCATRSSLPSGSRIFRPRARRRSREPGPGQ